MLCENCGNPVNEGQKLCDSCKTAVNSPSPSDLGGKNTKKKHTWFVAALCLVAALPILLLCLLGCVLGIGLVPSLLPEGSSFFDFEMLGKTEEPVLCYNCGEAEGTPNEFGNYYCDACRDLLFCSKADCDSGTYKDGLCHRHYNNCAGCSAAHGLYLINGNFYCDSCENIYFCLATGCINERYLNSSYCQLHAESYGLSVCTSCGLNMSEPDSDLCSVCSTVNYCSKCDIKEAEKGGMCEACFNEYFGYCHQCGGSFFEFGNYYSFGGKNRFCVDCYNDIMN